MQKQIVDALGLAGYRVRETTAYRQKGPSGVDKGIPDLLVGHPLVPFLFLGIEVKRPGAEKRFSSKEQAAAHSSGEFMVASGSLAAIEAAERFLYNCAPPGELKIRAIRKSAAARIAIAGGTGGTA